MQPQEMYKCKIWFHRSCSGVRLHGNYSVLVLVFPGYCLFCTARKTSCLSSEIAWGLPGLVIMDCCSVTQSMQWTVFPSAITCVGGHLWKELLSLLTVLPGLQDQHWRPHLCLHSTAVSVRLTKGILFLCWYWASCRNTHHHHQTSMID